MNKPAHPLSTGWKRSRRRGFTLAEILVALAIFTLLSAGVIQMSLFLATSQSVTTGRLNSVAKAQRVTIQLSRAARRSETFIVYSDYAEWGYDSTALMRTTASAFVQSGVHLGVGDTGNYLVMVELHDDSDTTDKIPAPVAKVTGLYVDPTDWKETDGSVKADAEPYLPVRLFVSEFSESEGVVGDGTTVLEDLLPDASAANNHEILGYINTASLGSRGLFNLLDLDTVTLNIPIRMRATDEAAALQLETTLAFTGD